MFKFRMFKFRLFKFRPAFLLEHSDRKDWRLTCFVMLLLMSSFSTAKGSFIHSTARATSYSVTEYDEPPAQEYDDADDQGNNAFATASSSAAGTKSSTSGYAGASARFTRGGFDLSAEVEVSWSSSDLYVSPYGQSKSIATWTDVIYLQSPSPTFPGPSPMGETLRLNFHSVLGASDSTIGFAGGIVPLTSFTLMAQGTHQATASEIAATTAAAYFQEGNTTTSGFDQISDGGNYFWHLDIPLTGDGYGYVPGAVWYQVSLIVDVTGHARGGSIFAWDPTQFLSITLPDVGNVTPESLGVQLAFESGINSPNISAVPEPSSLALLGVGGIGMLLATGLRRCVRARVGTEPEHVRPGR